MERTSLARRAAQWVDQRLELTPVLESILKKPVPKHARAWYFCLGGSAFFFFFVQVLSGILLTLYYRPTPKEAYASILMIMNEVRFGWLIRSTHAWSANLMILAVFGHMVRVFVTGAYKRPRELNWVAGVLLFLVTLTFGFTGYLLPWDQRAYWATTVGTELVGGVPVVGPALLVLLRGGESVSALTLTRFYGIHVMVLPWVALLLLGAHFWMIRRQGISGPL